MSAQRDLEIGWYPIGSKQDAIDIQPLIFGEDLRELGFDTDRSTETVAIDLNEAWGNSWCVPAAKFRVR